MNNNKAYFNWSSGKDSALALHYLLQDEQYSVKHLLTTVNAHHQRVSMHGLRIELLQQQLKAIGIPHDLVELPKVVTNEAYERLLGKQVQRLSDKGFTYAAFGDIFLEDLRQYRETQLEAFNIKTVFPLWKKDTKALINEFIQLGFKTVVVCANADLLDQSFAGRVIDESFLKDLPANVDPCGENGEFHTFCFDAPYFKKPIPYSIGETVTREYEHAGIKSRFWFCDLLPA